MCSQLYRHFQNDLTIVMQTVQVDLQEGSIQGLIGR